MDLAFFSQGYPVCRQVPGGDPVNRLQQGHASGKGMKDVQCTDLVGGKCCSTALDQERAGETQSDGGTGGRCWQSRILAVDPAVGRDAPGVKTGLACLLPALCKQVPVEQRSSPEGEMKTERRPATGVQPGWRDDERRRDVAEPTVRSCGRNGLEQLLVKTVGLVAIALAMAGPGPQCMTENAAEHRARMRDRRQRLFRMEGDGPASHRQCRSNYATGKPCPIGRTCRGLVIGHATFHAVPGWGLPSVRHPC